MSGVTGLSPKSLFDSYFRSAEVLLKVYSLLESRGSDPAPGVPQAIREILLADEDEMLLYLLNDMFVGVVRERAQLPNGFFRQQNMALLLRQAVVASCTALDVYYPAVLREHLPTMIAVRRRNFIPNDKEVRAFLRDVTLTIDDHLRLVDEREKQFDELGQFMLVKLGDKVMANVTAITVVMKLLGYDDPWLALSDHLGRRQEDLRSGIDALVKRRNDIVHRGDRDRKSEDQAPRPIDYSWTHIHVRVAESVVHACDELVTKRMAEYAPLIVAHG